MEKYPYNLGEFLFMMLPSALKKAKVLSIEESKRKKEDSKDSNTIFIKAQTFDQRYRLWREKAKEALKTCSVVVCFPQITYLKEAYKKIKDDFKGYNLCLMHSQQKDSELLSYWQKSRKNSLILTTRVGLFYYPQDLNLVIVEEESSPYYFQEEKPYYHLSDVVAVLSKSINVDTIFSDDIPRLSTYRLIKEEKTDLIQQPEEGKKIRVVDMPDVGRKKVLNPILRELIRKNIEAKKSSVILYNRTGLSRLISCPKCEHVMTCQRCSAFLKTSLGDMDVGTCPYCGKKQNLPKICPGCNKGYLHNRGLGIEKIEVILKKIFPEGIISEWPNYKDSDIILATAKILSSLYSNNTFDTGFVIDIDRGLSHLDYETTFNIFRYIKKCALLFDDNFYLFTRNAKHYLFESLNDNWHKFYEKELALRKEFSLPPYGFLMKVVLRAKSEKNLSKKSEDLYNVLKEKRVDVHGPFHDHPFKLRGKYRYVLVVKSKTNAGLKKAVEEVKKIRGSHLQAAIIMQ
jgi:primosomal protein N' (replication factor Y)